MCKYISTPPTWMKLGGVESNSSEHCRAWELDAKAPQAQVTMLLYCMVPEDHTSSPQLNKVFSKFPMAVVETINNSWLPIENLLAN